jgi:hypothetical protein
MPWPSRGRRSSWRLALPDRELFLTSIEDDGSVSIFRLDGHDR